MPKATLTLKNGTLVTVEGDVEEVQRLLALYSEPEAPERTAAAGSGNKHTPTQGGAVSRVSGAGGHPGPHEIANAAKECAEASAIASRILDSRSQLARALLPLYVVSEYLGGKFALTMPEISQVTRALGALVDGTNVAKVMRTSGARYVMAEHSGNKADPKRFRLSRRGVEFIKSILKGDEPK